MSLESETNGSEIRWPWVLLGGCALLMAIALLMPRSREPRLKMALSSGESPGLSVENVSVSNRSRVFSRTAGSGSVVRTAEEIVTNKLAQFARSRRDLVHALARHYQVEVPHDVERFFDAVEAGRWDEMQSIYQSLRERRISEEGSEKFGKLWPALHETLGVAEAVQSWPPQKLLEYGQSILGTLRPGMVYVGGTDPGRYIPTLLNETSAGERHVVLTQNALADRTYLEYVSFQYGDRFTAPTEEDSARAFQDYINDAKKRFEHDQQFPDEPRQVRPGEDIRSTDNRIQVSGQVAVMAINEKLLRAMLDQNPDASFAIEQSFPFTSLYGDTRPLGPIMELRVPEEQYVLTRERAAQSADYWRDASRELLSGAGELPPEVRTAYGKMAAEQAALLLHHGYTAEAEQTFRLATEMGPASADAVFRYVSLLTGQKRFDEALRVTENAIRADAERQHEFGRLASELTRMKKL